MTAMTLYQVEERMQDRRTSFQTGPDVARLRELLGEVLQVLGAGLLPTTGAAPELSEPLRRDLGLS